MNELSANVETNKMKMVAIQQYNENTNSKFTNRSNTNDARLKKYWY